MAGYLDELNNIWKNGSSAVKNALNVGATLGGPQYPWRTIDNNAFWPAVEIDGERWNKLYPYKLLVVAPNTDGTYSVVSSPKGTDSLGNLQTQIIEHGYIISPTMGRTWSYQFPISFQQLNITDQYAINSIATLKGISEEHNGVKFKLISASGTCGIFPERKNISPKPNRPGGITGAAMSAFGGTLDAIKSAGEQLKKTAMAATGGHPALVGINSESELVIRGSDLQKTGYFKMMLLGQFLERYVEAKKLPENKNWHLAINMPKQNQTFLVTPLQFSLTQNANKPMEYLYSFQLKAFKRVSVNEKIQKSVQNQQLKLNSNGYLTFVNTLKQARLLMSSASNIVKAVRSDFIGIMDNLRQVTLLVKDITGTVRSVADLPSQLIKDLKESIADMKTDLNMAADSLKKNSYDNRSSGSANVAFYKQSNVDVSATQSKNNPTTQSKALSDSDPSNAIFNNPHDNFAYLDTISADKIKLSNKQQDVVDQEISEIRQLTTDDLRKTKNTLLSVATDLSNSFGAGDATFAKTYKKEAPTPRSIPMGLEENELIASIFDVIQSLEDLTADQTFDDNKKQSPMEYVGQTASDLGITFQQTTNKKKVPVPFGLTIEEIALRYLGNPDRWLEIATLNNLSAPYIDETGFQLPLLSNGSGRQFTVNDSGLKLWIGQTVYLRSNTKPTFTRKITAIDGVEASNRLITVDGLADLDSLKTVDNAYLQGYRSGTFNSQNLIWIPTDTEATPDKRSNLIPFLPKDDLNVISNVDFLLTEDGDLAISSSGEFRLANGMTNLIQAIRLKINTERGRLFRHQDYGLGDLTGTSNADLDVQEVYKMINSTISTDPRFAGIKDLVVELVGPTLNISMEVQIINSEMIVPVSFSA